MRSKEIRKGLFIAICDALSGITGKNAIAHIDMWNQNVQYIEQENQWDTPAVFIEFQPIAWTMADDGKFQTVGRINLHVVTRWEGSAAAGSAYQGDALAVFDLLQRINLALDGLSGDTFHDLRRESSVTNHNHEELLENIETYRYKGYDYFVAENR